jgi:hypothetical protein
MRRIWPWLTVYRAEIEKMAERERILQNPKHPK